jgi:hypothetical protein
MLQILEHDLKDAFGEPARQAVLLFALTELRLLSGHWGIESIIKKDPDVVLTVADAARAQAALTGAPGTLRVIDPQTVYLRMPASFMEPDTLLMVLKNLMRQAYDRELKGETIAQPGKAPTPPPPAKVMTTSTTGGDGERVTRVSAPAPPARPAKPKKPIRSTPDLEKLQSLRDAGILSEEEFRAARDRLLAKM